MIQKENSYGTFDQEINAFFKDVWYYVKKMDKLNREFDHLINLVP